MSHAIVPIVPVAEAEAGVLVANFKEVRVPSEVIAGWAAVVTVAAVVAVVAVVALPVKSDFIRFATVIFFVMSVPVTSTMGKMSSVAGLTANSVSSVILVLAIFLSGYRGPECHYFKVGAVRNCCRSRSGIAIAHEYYLPGRRCRWGGRNCVGRKRHYRS